MKILAINGSHRPGQNCDVMINAALEAADAAGVSGETVNLADLDIRFCTGCNRCLFKPGCSIDDDQMEELREKMRQADGILLASPNYFANVTARMKNFFDRTRPMHMLQNELKGKVTGYLVMTGLDNCGAEATAAALDRWCQIQETLTVHPRKEGPVTGLFVTGSLLDGFNEEGLPRWRRDVSTDPVALPAAMQLGHDMAELIKRLA